MLNTNYLICTYMQEQAVRLEWSQALPMDRFLTYYRPDPFFLLNNFLMQKAAVGISLHITSHILVNMQWHGACSVIYERRPVFGGILESNSCVDNFYGRALSPAVGQ